MIVYVIEIEFYSGFINKILMMMDTLMKFIINKIIIMVIFKVLYVLYFYITLYIYKFTFYINTVY